MSAVSNLATTSENLSASRSRIQDADFAAETAAMTRGQILQQAGTAILAQANSLPNSVLSCSSKQHEVGPGREIPGRGFWLSRRSTEHETRYGSATRGRIESSAGHTFAGRVRSNCGGITALCARAPGRATAAARKRRAAKQAAARINEFLKSSAANVEFTVDAASDDVIVRVIDSETHQLIRQMPTEETLAISRALDRLSGLLLAQKA